MDTAPPTAAVTISRGELLWITLGMWVGGLFMLTLLPILLIPRLGIPSGVAVSYVVFFLAWQPVQVITQRVFGMRAAVIRMLALVGSDALLAYYLREALMTLAPGSPAVGG